MIPSNHRCFIGSWSAGGFDTVLAADMTYASRKVEGHAGSFGRWSLVGGGAEDAYIVLDVATTYPVYVYGLEYTGQGAMGANKIEYPKKFSLKIGFAGPDKFSVTHTYGPDELVFIRKEKMPDHLLAVQLDEMKTLMAIAETSQANDRATWNKQFKIAEDLQDARWKIINSHRPA